MGDSVPMQSSGSRPAARHHVGSIALAFALAVSCGPAFAQSNNTELRLNKVESEVKALQRKVFPGAGDRYFTPEISAPAPTTVAGPPPSTSALSDVLTRMQSVEAQVARLTGQVEQNSNRIAQLEARLAGSNAQPLGPVAQTNPSSAYQAPGNTAPIGSGTPVVRPTPVVTPPASAKPIVAPTSDRVRAVSAVVKPSTGDAAEDEYSYGFRLWEAKFYPEAQQQLNLFLEKYPKSARASWARNLLGRAYLDDANSLEAAKWFVQNYQTDKRGERAPDSLLYLAVAMKQLKDTKRACIAYSEFGATYPAEAAGRLKSVYDATRNGLNCT